MLTSMSQRSPSGCFQVLSDMAMHALPVMQRLLSSNEKSSCGPMLSKTWRANLVADKQKYIPLLRLLSVDRKLVSDSVIEVVCKHTK